MVENFDFVTPLAQHNSIHTCLLLYIFGQMYVSTLHFGARGFTRWTMIHVQLYMYNNSFRDPQAGVAHTVPKYLHSLAPVLKILCVTACYSTCSVQTI